MTLGFGLERLGLIALRFPRITLLLVFILTAPLFFFATQISFSSDIREIFRSESRDFAQLEEVTTQYPGNNRDILLAVEGADLFTRDNLEALRTLHLDLALGEGVSHVLSMFSARQPPGPDGHTATIVPASLDDVDDLERLQAELQRHPFVSGKLLSDDARMALFVVALQGRYDIPDLRRLTGDIKAIATDILQDTKLQVHLTGLPFIRIDIIGSLIRDQKTFSIVGLIIGLALCWIFFRSFTYAVIAGVPSVVALSWLLGSMRLMGQEVTVLTSVVPALVMVIVFADALHLLFGIKRGLVAGKSVEDAIVSSVTRVGPACVLTSITTTLALLSLTLVQHPFISGFGLTAAVGTAIAFVTTLTAVPALSILFLHRIAPDTRPDVITRATAAICEWTIKSTLSRPRTVLSTGVLLAVLAGVLYAATDRRYQYREYLPAGNPTLLAMDRIDSKLAGTDTLQLFIQWPKDARIESPETLEVVREAHEILAGSGLVREVWSLHSIETWLAEGGSGGQDLFCFLHEQKSQLTTRLLSVEGNSTLLIGHFPGTDAAVLLPLLDRLETRIAAIGEKHRNVRFLLTGLAVVSAKASSDMIRQLNRSLLIAIGVIILLIAVALRSARAGLVSILPNLLPIAVSGSLLYATGQGLQFTSVIAFTIGFGMAVDSTIHVLTGFRISQEEGATTTAALESSIRTVGPVLIISTIVLSSGLGSTLLSELPNLRLFGQVSIVLLLTALIADLVLLPCIVAVVEGRRKGVAD